MSRPRDPFDGAELSAPGDSPEATPLGFAPALTTGQGAELTWPIPRPFVMRFDVGRRQVDAQGHVNNAVYVRWMDLAAVAHSRAVGYPPSAYDRLGTAFVVRRHEIDYHAAAFEGQTLIDATWSEPMHKTTAIRKHRIYRLDDGRLLVSAVTRWVYVERGAMRPKRIPPELARAFNPPDESPSEDSPPNETGESPA